MNKFLIILFFTAIIGTQYSVAQIILNIDTLGNKKMCDSATLVFSYTPDIGGGVWDFGNNSTSTLNTDTVTYTNGKFTGTLKFSSNPALNKNFEIIINTTPVAGFIDTIIKSTGNYTRFIKNTSTLDTVNKPSYKYSLSIDNTILYKDSSNIGFFHTFPKPGNYNLMLTITDNKTCSDSISKQITIAELTQLNPPNSFTPNNDGKNELFIIEGDGVTLLNFEVFNRAGMKIFSSKASIITWDGKTSSGIEAPSGLYYYILTSDKTEFNTENVIHLFRSN